ncbi:MAG: copper resistance protein NlpE N-terminal domain-containing protein [Campylobacter sp.]
MRQILIFAVIVFTLLACAKKREECGNTEVFQTCSTKEKTIANEQIEGIYEAKINCEDCEKGSKSILILEKNGKFRLENNYIKKIPQREIQDGEFTIKNNIITTKNKYRENVDYKYENGNLVQLRDKNSFIKDQTALKIYILIAPIATKNNE